jgi:hypothetical protein
VTIFHNHIPRTSGGVINHYISQNKNISQYIIEPTDKIDPKNFKDKQYIAGHIGQLPQQYIDNVISFSFVRNPKEQWLSWFWLMYRQGLTVIDGKITESRLGTPQAYMEKFLYDDSFYPGTSNIQSKFLMGYVDIDLWNRVEEPIDKTQSNWCLKEYSLDRKDIDDALDRYIVETVENRNNLIEFINTIFEKKYNIVSAISDYEWSGHNTPKPNYLEFEIPKAWSERINELNPVDYYLYDRVKSKQKKYAIMSL